MAREVEFYFDFSSPYTYLAATQVGRLEESTGVSVTWKPFLLGAVFKGAGNQSPATVRPKVINMMVDLKRWGEYYDVPFNMPRNFPANTIAALRMAIAADEQGEIVKFSERVFKAYWAEDANIADKETLVKLASEIGLDGDALLKRTGDQDVKDKLKENTDGAVKRGAFGAPTFFVGNEMFWGNDRVMMLERFLKG